MYRNFIDGFVGESVDGSGRPLNIGNEPWNTYHVICDGDIGIQATGYTEIYKEGNTAVITTPNTISRGSVIGLANVLIAEKISPTPTGILRPRYVLPEGQVDQGDGRYGFESTYKMGIMTSEFFTELSVIGVTNGSTAWTVGEVVTGELSGAYGVIETGSNTETLIVSNVVGEFRAGEELTQEPRFPVSSVVVRLTPSVSPTRVLPVPPLTSPPRPPSTSVLLVLPPN